MNKYRVRIRYAGSVLVEVKAEDEAQAQEKGERTAADMDSDTFLSALGPQHLGTEVTRLCSTCGCELQTTGQHICSIRQTKQLAD
jgi:hypothetical protein